MMWHSANHPEFGVRLDSKALGGSRTYLQDERGLYGTFGKKKSEVRSDTKQVTFLKNTVGSGTYLGT